MLIVFVILIILASLILGLVILVQNPKGGGLSATFGGVGNQLMGVKQTTDVLEKGTWLFATVVGVLCLTSALFIPSGTGTGADKYYDAPASAPQTQSPTRPATSLPPGQTNPQPAK